MKLHEDDEAFAELISATAEAIGLPQLYVEKDYWVTLALKNLSESDYIDDVVFKGGTSLSKAYRLIDRFSEDIDLAVFSGDRGDSARKKLLKGVEASVASGLVYLEGNERESKGSRFRKTVYQYPRSIEGADFGQASPELLLEINAFTHPEPYEKRELKTFISEALADLGKEDLIVQYGLQNFSINVLSIKRTLVEKMLGVIKDSYNADPAAKLSDRIRHLYDICLILREDEHKNFLKVDEFHTLCEQCIEDEKAGFFDYSDCLEKPLSEAPLFSNFKDWISSLESTYKGVFADLVYGDLPEIKEIESSLALLKTSLEQRPN